MDIIEGYESPDESDGVVDLIINDVANECINQLRNKEKSRIGFFLDKVYNQRGRTSIILHILLKLEETGKYNSTPIRLKETEDIDFLISNKTWIEKSPILYELKKQLSSKFMWVVIAFIIGLLFGRSCNLLKLPG